MLTKILIGTAAVLVTLAAIAAIMNAAEGGPAASAAPEAPTRDKAPRAIARPRPVALRRRTDLGHPLLIRHVRNTGIRAGPCTSSMAPASTAGQQAPAATVELAMRLVGSKA